MKYISINIEPKGRIPPRMMMTIGFMNHFFSGIGLGTALILQGLFARPEIFLPNTVPTNVKGKIIKTQMLATANCVKRN